ncbi:hypothetical protein IKF21_03205 [Candidatus Saccharibacteria bacterium]|nr:hypothetical protein [Candidatus Saccharibacteria bacterium]
MEENNSTQKTDVTLKGNDLDSEKQVENQSLVEQKKSNKTKTWLIVAGIMVGIIAVAGIVVGVLATNGIFSDNSCPVGTYRVCGPLAGGEESCHCSSNRHEILKPIIYLYPENETEMTVRLGIPENLTASYPKYVDGWDVIAYPDGTLVDKSNGNKLYSLYWEGVKDSDDLDKTIGFMVKGADSAKFLEEKLEILGLNYKEKEEFIVYWLPKLESHDYNYIYFATEEEIETEMPLEFSVEPDTLIRIRMIFEGLNEYKEVEEQTLIPAPERNGFTVVEWGGTDLTSRNN